MLQDAEAQERSWFRVDEAGAAEMPNAVSRLNDQGADKEREENLQRRDPMNSRDCESRGNGCQTGRDENVGRETRSEEKPTDEKSDEQKSHEAPPKDRTT